MWLLSRLIGASPGLLDISLSPPAEMARQLIAIGFIGVLFMLFFRLIDRREVRCMGFVNVKTLPKEALLGVVAGFGMFTLCILAVLLLGGAKFEGVNQGTLGLALIMLPCVLFQSFGKEVMYRGYFFVNSTVKLPLWPAAIVNGLLFAAGHLPNAGSISFFALLNLTLVSVLFSVLVIRRGSIWAARTLHGFWNYTQGFLYGLPVSGTKPSGGTLLQFPLADGRPLVTGGILGIEASLPTTIVEALAIFTVL